MARLNPRSLPRLEQSLGGSGPGPKRDPVRECMAHGFSRALCVEGTAMARKAARKPSTPPPSPVVPIVPANGGSMPIDIGEATGRRGFRTQYPPNFLQSGGGGGGNPFGGPVPPNGGGNGFVGTVERIVDVGERIAGFFGVGGESAKKEGKALVARNEPASDCPTGTFKVGNRCVAPGDAFPGGDPFITQAGGQTTMGAFGMPAVTPVQEQRVHRSCPTGMVLGKDNLCYPRAVLPRRSRFRKWRPGMKPLLTGGDRKAIRKAERVANKLKGEQKRLRKTKNALNKVL